MTDLFKCKKSGTQCCAPKTRILEVQGTMMSRNDTIPAFVNQQQVAQAGPQYMANNNNYSPQLNGPLPQTITTPGLEIWKKNSKSNFK